MNFDHHENVSSGIETIVAIQSAHFIRRRATGEAHRVPGSHACFSSRRSTTKPKPSASTVPATKYGRNGSNVAASPAPLRPSATATSGPAQQSVDATAAATPPVAASTVLVTDVGMIFQDLEDRALGRGSPYRARRSQPLQRALHALKVADLLLDDVDLLSGFPLDGIAGGAVPDAQPEQLLDLLQRETELLCVLDEAEARHCIVGVLAIPSRSAPRGRKEAPSLVIADRLDVYVGRGCDLSDSQSHAALLPEVLVRNVNHVPWYRVKGFPQLNRGYGVTVIVPVNPG